MPYHVSLTTIASEQHYRVVVVDELDGLTARHLADWLDAARLNPGARFEIDFSEARWVDSRALERLARRQDTLRAEQRLSVVGQPPRVRPGVGLLPASAVLALEPLLAVPV